MKEGEDMTRTRICPKCGKAYTEAPALSRADNETPICPDCGIRESMEIFGVNEEECERIIEIIHRSCGRN